MRILELIPFILLFFIFSCDTQKTVPDQSKQEPSFTRDGNRSIEFSFYVDRDVYDYTVYGEPPQMAVWLEHTDSNLVQTVWVSNRSGKNQWKGKVECPVALPYWESRHRFEKSDFQERNLLERLLDAITGATPTGGPFTTTIQVPDSSQWIYFIEVNASGDYNKTFTYWSADGLPDSEGNGQPSIVYSGSITALAGNKDIPELKGRTEQRRPVDSLSPDLESIDTAKKLIRDIQVTVR